MARRSKYDTEVGAALAETLARKRTTQARLAEGLAQSTAYVNQVMTGRKPVAAQWLDLVADTMGLSPKERERLHRAGAKDRGFKIDLTKPD